MTDSQHADLHCDVEVAAHWELPGQAVVSVRLTGTQTSEHVFRWLADPEFKAEFLGEPGVRIIAAGIDSENQPGMTQDRSVAWVECPEPSPTTTSTGEFRIHAAGIEPGRSLGRVAVIQRDPYGVGEEVAWALSATFDLIASAGVANAGAGIEVSSPRYQLTAAVNDFVDEDGTPGSWSEYTAEVVLVPGETGECCHEPCFGEEIYVAAPQPALEIVSTP